MDYLTAYKETMYVAWLHRNRTRILLPRNSIYYWDFSPVYEIELLLSGKDKRIACYRGNRSNYEYHRVGTLQWFGDFSIEERARDTCDYSDDLRSEDTIHLPHVRMALIGRTN